MRVEMDEAPRLAHRAQDLLAAEVDCVTEAFELLKIIDAEFHTDPKSRQCFDPRIVERVRECVAKRAQLEREMPWLRGSAPPSTHSP